MPSLRPSNLAQDSTTTEATLKDALEKFEALTNEYFDICVFLTCTDIFRDTAWITSAIEKLENDRDLESSVCGMPNAQKFLAKDEQGAFKRVLKKMEVYSSRQEKEPIYREDTGLARLVLICGAMGKELEITWISSLMKTLKHRLIFIMSLISS